MTAMVLMMEILDSKSTHVYPIISDASPNISPYLPTNYQFILRYEYCHSFHSNKLKSFFEKQCYNIVYKVRTELTIA